MQVCVWLWSTTHKKVQDDIFTIFDAFVCSFFCCHTLRQTTHHCSTLEFFNVLGGAMRRRSSISSTPLDDVVTVDEHDSWLELEQRNFTETELSTWHPNVPPYSPVRERVRESAVLV
jgi:hypothetical protein